MTRRQQSFGDRPMTMATRMRQRISATVAMTIMMMLSSSYNRASLVEAFVGLSSSSSGPAAYSSKLFRRSKSHNHDNRENHRISVLHNGKSGDTPVNSDDKLPLVVNGDTTASLIDNTFSSYSDDSNSNSNPADDSTTTSQAKKSKEKTYTGFDSFRRVDPSRGMPSGESSRKFRRTIYSHKDWVKHRSSDRFLFYVRAIFKSGVYKGLAKEIVLHVVLAGMLVVWNGLATGGFGNPAGSKPLSWLQRWLPKLALPLTPLTLSSPSLGLLLVFRTNTSYGRWDEARKNWGSTINRTRDLVRMSNAYYDDKTSAVSPAEREDDLNHVALCTWAFARCMKRHLSPDNEDEDMFVKEITKKLPAQQARNVLAAEHRPLRALQDLSYAVDDLPMHFLRKNQIHGAITQLEDNLGSCERLLTSPVPVFYTRHLARFLSVWFLLLPFALFDTFAFTWNSVGLIPTMAIMTVMLFGIEQLGTELEEPFTILPMQAFCDKIYGWVKDIASWKPGDNGRPLKQTKPQHVFFAPTQIDESRIRYLSSTNEAGLGI